MDVEVINTGELNRVLLIKIAADQVKTDVESKVRKIAQTANVPGFRRGKVPTSLIEQRFMPSIKSDVLNELAQKYVPEALQDQGLNPIYQSQPRLKDGVDIDGEVDIEFFFSVELAPQIDVRKLSEVSIEIPDVQISEDDIEAEVLNVRKSFGETTTVEREPKQGDLVTCTISRARPRLASESDESAAPTATNDESGEKASGADKQDADMSVTESKAAEATEEPAPETLKIELGFSYAEDSYQNLLQSSLLEMKLSESREIADPLALKTHDNVNDSTTDTQSVTLTLDKLEEQQLVEFDDEFFNRPDVPVENEEALREMLELRLQEQSAALLRDFKASHAFDLTMNHISPVLPAEMYMNSVSQELHRFNLLQRYRTVMLDHFRDDLGFRSQELLDENHDHDHDHVHDHDHNHDHDDSQDHDHDGPHSEAGEDALSKDDFLFEMVRSRAKQHVAETLLFQAVSQEFELKPNTEAIGVQLNAMAQNIPPGSDQAQEYDRIYSEENIKQLSAQDVWLQIHDKLIEHMNVESVPYSLSELREERSKKENRLESVKSLQFDSLTFLDGKLQPLGDGGPIVEGNSTAPQDSVLEDRSRTNAKANDKSPPSDTDSGVTDDPVEDKKSTLWRRLRGK